MQIFIYPKDIMILTGRRNIKSGHRYYNKILKHFGKTKDQGVLISEYCKYFKADEKQVMLQINPGKENLAIIEKLYAS